MVENVVTFMRDMALAYITFWYNLYRLFDIGYLELPLWLENAWRAYDFHTSERHTHLSAVSL